MPTSSITSIETSFVSQIVSGTTLEGALAGSEQTVTTFPYAFVNIVGDAVTYEGNTQLDAEYLATVLVQAKDPELVRYVIQELFVLFVAYGSANAMYAYGLYDIAPESFHIPGVVNPAANEVYYGDITYRMKVRYTYT